MSFEEELERLKMLRESYKKYNSSNGSYLLRMISTRITKLNKIINN